MDRAILAAFATLFAATWFYMSGQPTPIDNPPAALRKGPTLVYFGARDCPACRSFVKGGGLKEMETFAREKRIPFVVQEIASLRDLGKAGVFADFTPVWRATTGRTGRLAVPTFAFIRDGGVVHAGAGDWRGILRKADADIEG